MSARSASLLWIGLIAATAIGFSFLSGPVSDSDRSASSIAPTGRRAWFELLSRLDFEPRTWTLPPGDLPEGPAVLFLPDVPAEPLGYDLTDAEQRERSVRRARDPKRYRSFVRSGGVLIAAYTDELAEFLADTLGVEPLDHLVAEELDVESAVFRVDGSPEATTLALDEVPVFESLPRRSPWRTLATTDDGRALAVRLEIELGDLVLLSTDEFLENGRLGEADHALLGVRLLEAVARGPRVLFDEYTLGAWSPPTPLELAFSESRRVLSIHVAVALLLYAWWVARPGAFPREGREAGALSPLVRAAGFANLMVRGARYEQLAGMLRRGVLRRLVPRGVAVEGDVLTPVEVERVLERLGMSRDPDTLGRWKRALCSRPASDPNELESLAADLAGLEEEAVTAEVELGIGTRV